jgi:hypothetical protein
MSDEAPPNKILDATEVAARHFVYKLYDTAEGQQWSAGRKEALTDEGRRLARKGR